jgi:hypothetical protein
LWVKASRPSWTRQLHPVAGINQENLAADEETMAVRIRGSTLLVFAGFVAIYVTYRGFAPQPLSDYGTEAAPAMNALLAGHLHAFFALQPAYGGSLVLRAPASLLAKVLGGDQLAIYRAGAFPCVLACGLLGVWLATRMRRLGRPLVAWLPALLICALAPLITDAILQGHPEEALGAALCVAAVLLAADGRATLAGLALGLAIVTKQWGVLAALPAVLAVPSRPGARGARVRLLALGAALPAAQLILAHIESPGGAGALVGGAQQAGFAHAFDVWWPAAHASRHLAVGSPPAWIVDWSLPAFVADHAHQLIVAISLPLAAVVVRRHGWSPPIHVCLALLALLFLLRCALDPEDLFYYHLPFLVTLLAWETYSRRGAPWVSIVSLLSLYVVFEEVGATDAHKWADFTAYFAVALPLAGYLFAQLLGRPVRRRAVVGSVSPSAAHP